MSNRIAIIGRILAERERQSNLPGCEFDLHNTPNEWVSIVGHYLYEETRRGVIKPTRRNFEDSLMKAAAVLLAALEHSESMEMAGNFDEQSY